MQLTLIKALCRSQTSRMPPPLSAGINSTISTVAPALGGRARPSRLVGGITALLILASLAECQPET